MTVHSKSRPYAMDRRRAAGAATTERILDAALARFEADGAAAVTVSATARDADVQRLTLYRRFADDDALIRAMLQRELRRDPPPGPSAWEAETDRLERCRAALAAWFSWRLRRSALAEAASAGTGRPAVREFLAALDVARRRAAEDLGSRWPAAERAGPLVQVLGAVFEDGVFAGLARHGCGPERAAALAVVWIEAAAF